MRPYLTKRARKFNQVQTIEATIVYDEERHINVLNKDGENTVLMDLSS